MLENKNKAVKTVGEMQKRRETMQDGRRYIIYYTFETNDELGMMNGELDKSGTSNSSFIIPNSSFPENV